MHIWKSIRGLSAVAVGLLLLTGCQHGAKQPAVTTDGHEIPAASLQRGPSLADLTGGDLGVGGGFLIGAAPDKVTGHQRAEAVAAAQKAEQLPAQLQQVHEAKTADLNNDGYVTLDEVLAMVRAGLSPQEVSARLKETQYIFHTTPEQERYLTDRGVKPDVIVALRSLNNSTIASTEK